MSEALSHVETSVSQQQQYEAGAAVVQLANAQDSVQAAEQTAAPKIDWPTPHYFRDHTNPYTMGLPQSWGSTRRT